MTAADWARQLFTPPGAGAAHAARWFAATADLHASLLASARDARQEAGHPPHGALEALCDFAASSRAAALRQRVLDHPQLIEALHALADAAPPIAAWDAAVVPGATAREDLALGLARLGNVALPRMIERAPDWSGAVEIASDAYGLVHFPGCAWSVALARRAPDDVEPYADHRITLTLDESWASFRALDDDAPLLVMSRPDFLRLVRGRYGAAWRPSLLRRNPAIRVRLQATCRLDRSRLEYEPVGRTDAEGGRLNLTGAIVREIVAAISRHAPEVYRELVAYVRCIRGFELPALPGGAVGSFSTPLRPGLVGFNVEYDESGGPRLDPCCFTWLGHELGHNKNYVLDEVAFVEGEQFLENGAETRFIPRYGRELSLRTVFQIPYVHLYEVALLDEFAARGCEGLPWKIEQDLGAVGDDLLAEIDEACQLIADHARLTAWGRAALARQRELTEVFRERHRRAAAG